MQYPSFDWCVGLIRREWAHDPLRLAGNFNYVVYDNIKKCFESQMDGTVVVEAGGAIGEYGGIAAMQCAYYASILIVHAMCDTNDCVLEHHEHRNEMKYKMAMLWRGIHGWRD